MLSYLYTFSFISLSPFIYIYWDHSWEAPFLPLTTDSDILDHSDCIYDTAPSFSLIYILVIPLQHRDNIWRWKSCLIDHCDPHIIQYMAFA